MKKIKTIYFIGILLLVALFILFYFLFDKEYKISYTEKFCINPPFSYPPAILSVLFRFSKVPARCIFSSILFLKAVDIIEINLKFTKQKNTTIELTLCDIKKVDYCPLSHELFLLKWIFGDIEQGNTITLQQIKERLLNEKVSENFISNYNNWKKAIVEDSLAYNFFDYNKHTKYIGGFIGIAYCFFGIIMTFFYMNFMFLLFTFFGLLFLRYVKNMRKRSREGQEQFEKWLAFKRFCRNYIENNDNSSENPYEVEQELYATISYIMTLDILNPTELYKPLNIDQFDLFFKEIFSLEKIIDEI